MAPGLSARPYYTGQELALILGLTSCQFYRAGVRQRYHRVYGLPRPYVERPMRFDRASIDAWRMRFHPGFPTAACNDPLPQPPASTDAEHRAELHEIYGRRRA